MEVGNVSEMEKGCFGDVWCLICWWKERAGSKVTPRLQMWRQGAWGAIDGEGEVTGGFDEGFGNSDDDVWFVTVKFEEVGLKPGFQLNDSVGEDRVSSRSDGLVTMWRWMSSRNWSPWWRIMWPRGSMYRMKRRGPRTEPWGRSCEMRAENYK